MKRSTNRWSSAIDEKKKSSLNKTIDLPLEVVELIDYSVPTETYLVKSAEKMYVLKVIDKHFFHKKERSILLK